jgi:hypothetical protein
MRIWNQQGTVCSVVQASLLGSLEALLSFLG